MTTLQIVLLKLGNIIKINININVVNINRLNIILNIKLLNS
jgi:hypothetical protein